MNTMDNNGSFRVAILHSSAEESVILTHQMELPSGELHEKESFEHAAQRIAKTAFDLEYLSAVARIAPIDGVQGYILEAAGGHKTDLRRSFAGRAFELDFILKDAEENADKYRRPDIAILRAYSDRSFQR